MDFQQYMFDLADEVEADDPGMAAVFRADAAHKVTCPLCPAGHRPHEPFFMRDKRDDPTLPHLWVCGNCETDIERENSQVAERLNALTDEAVRVCRQATLRDIRELAISNRFKFGDYFVRLNDQTQGRIGDAIQGLELTGSDATIDWQMSAGVFVTMDVATLKTFGSAAFWHMQDCFAYSRTLTDLINADTPDLDLEAGWPGEAQ